MLVQVRYFAGAAAAAGVQEELVDVVAGGPTGSVATVADLRRDLAALHPPLSPVLEVATVLVAETASGPDVPLGGDEAVAGRSVPVVDVLPPFAGG